MPEPEQSSSRRRVVVNADDFGRSQAINAGVVDAHVHGIVTSASLMVRHPAAPEAVAAAREHPELGLGLHLDLTEWERFEGTWRAKYDVVDTGDVDAVRQEIERQVESFRWLVGSDPTHLDSHQHVHRDEPVRSLALEAAASLGVPLREHGRIRYCGAFYGQDRHGSSFPQVIAAESLAALLSELAPGDTEIGCHPAAAAEPFTSYSAERPLELQALCDAHVRRTIRECDIQLCNFTQMAHN